MGFDRYRTFGLREEWFEGFMERRERWLEESILGPRQKEAFIRYMKDAFVWDCGLTDIGEYLRKLYRKDKDTAWHILWLNLWYGSDLFRWYTRTFEWGETITREQLIETLEKEEIAERTARNAVNSLINTFRRSPLGRWFGKEIEKNIFLKEGLKTAKPELIRYCKKHISICNDEDISVILGLPEEEIHRLKAMI